MGVMGEGRAVGRARPSVIDPSWLWDEEDVPEYRSMTKDKASHHRVNRSHGRGITRRHSLA